MKKNILIWAQGSKNWMGGIYYTRNIVFQLALIENVREKYNIYLCVDFSALDEFEGLVDLLDIEFIEQSKNREQILELCEQYNINIVLPMQQEPYSWLISDMCVYWIPDFQEIHLPENFSERVLAERKQSREYMARKHKSMILSSEDAYVDYISQYPDYKENVFVVHFVSYIEKILEKMNEDSTQQVLKKYNIDYEYIYVANQFWKHKNHITALKAMDRIVKSGHNEIHLVCTGFMQSYGEQRDEYVRSLEVFIKENNLEKNVHFLGLLDRDEQLCIMKSAKMLLQPSLFEGWGCSVEDAKVMGKTILLSDIPVHREQKDENTFLFSKQNDEQLAELIVECFNQDSGYDLVENKRKTYEIAKAYAEELEKAIEVIPQKTEKYFMQELKKMRAKKIDKLFGNMEPQYIGIYGTGVHTDCFLKSCSEVMDISKFCYFDSDERKWGQQYRQGIIYPPQQILQTGVKRIIISSSAYQDEIYQALQVYEGKVEIKKIYDSTEKNELLWA